MGLATAALVLAAGLAACLICGPPAAEAGSLLSEERGLSAPMSEGAGGGPLTDAGSSNRGTGDVGPEAGEKKRRGGRKGRKRAGKGKRKGKGKCKTADCKRERREKRKLRRKQKQERRRNKKSGGRGSGGRKNRGGRNKRPKDRNQAPGEEAPAPDAAAGGGQ